MSTAAAFKATYSDWRLIKGRKVVQVVFELPLENANEAYAALGGMPNPAAETWCGIARLNTGGMAAPVREGEASNNEARRPPSRNPYQVRAVMLCKDGLFRRWLEIESKLDDVSEEDAAVYIRTKCGVKSRSEILPNTEAGNRLDIVESAFRCWRDADRYVDAAE